jgi:hypothetical protein
VYARHATARAFETATLTSAGRPALRELLSQRRGHILVERYPARTAGVDERAEPEVALSAGIDLGRGGEPDRPDELGLDARRRGHETREFQSPG